MEWFVTVLIFFGIIALTAVLFGLWLLFTIVRLIFRGIGALVAPASPTRDRELAGARAKSLPPLIGTGLNTLPGARCVNSRCRGFNPTAARFCRRCGSALPQTLTTPLATKRVAMW
jgi:hypothetical protein